MDNMTAFSQQDNIPGNEKKRLLYERQKALLNTFLQRGAISRAQYDKSLSDLTVKMGFGGSPDGSPVDPVT